MRRYRGKRKKAFSAVILLLVESLLLSGCAGNIPLKGGGQEETEFTMETLGLEPDFSYERKPERPGIQIDRLGYLPGSSKMAVFQGEELPENFRVIEKDSGECVYEGEIRLREDAGDGILTGYGSFTELEEEGSYYIECDRIGCSYYFDIKKEVYLEVSRECGKVIEETQDTEKSQEAVELCEVVSYLLTACEMYPELLTEIWSEGNGAGNMEEADAGAFFRMLRKKTDLLLSMQDEKTGGIYRNTEALAVQEGRQDAEVEISAEATAAFAGTMAKYGYLYQEYDWDYANICLKAAAKAWRYLDRAVQGDNALESAVTTGRIYAASELYRASNERLYHNYILQNQELIADGETDLYLLMGKVTYLSTKRAVDHELCRQIMNGLMEEAENIAADRGTGLFWTEEEGTDTVMWDMTVLALANYAIMNHEYATVIENHLHYLLGRNAEGAMLLESTENTEAAKVLLLLSLVEAERKIVEEAESRQEL